MSPPESSCHPALLVDLVVNNILVRFPPDEPECLARASLVCKGWHAVLDDPGFRRRYGEFHRKSPMLGVLYNNFTGRLPHDSKFGSTTTFWTRTPMRLRLQVLDSRHGLVVFNCYGDGGGAPPRLLVWDPVTDAQWKIPFPGSPCADNVIVSYNVAVLCAADGCDHADCHGNPFLLVYVATYAGCLTSASCVYASEAGAWSYFTNIEHPHLTKVKPDCPSVLLGNTLYFSSEISGILEYNAAKQKLSWIESPFVVMGRKNDCLLVTTEDGSLGFVCVEDSCMVRWTRVSDKNGALEWAQCRIIELDKLLSARALFEKPHVIGFVEGAGAILLETYSGVLMVDLNSRCVKHLLCIRRRTDDAIPYMSIDVAIPYMSYYTPHTSLERAQQLFWKGSNAIDEHNIVDAVRCLGRAHEIRAAFYGELSPECAMTCYKYGFALLHKAQEEVALNILKSAQNEEPVSSATDQDDIGNSNAFVSNITDVLSLEKGQKSNGKCQEDRNHVRDNDDAMAGDEDYSDLDMAWKMLDNARAIVEKSPDHTVEKVQIFSALAAVSMEREDIGNSLDDCFKALAILDHLVEPEHHQIVTLNSRICSVFELAFKIGDMIPYCAKAISFCSSRILNLKEAKRDKGDNASSAEGGSEESALDNAMVFLTDILISFEKKLEVLEQEMSTPSPTTSEVVVASKDVTVEPRPVRILEFSECVSGTKVNKLMKVLWSNQTESEATWEHEDMMLQKYPELFQTGNGSTEA